MAYFSYESLKEAAKNRPEGYLEDILSFAVVKDGNVFLSDEDYAKLVEKYNPDLNKKVTLDSVTLEAQKLNERLKMAVELKNSGGAVTDPTGSDIQSPSLLTRAKTLATAGKNWAKSGFKQVTPEQLEQRLNICKSCPLGAWDQSAFGGTGKCKICGCSTQAKLRMATEKCPKDFWLPIKDS